MKTNHGSFTIKLATKISPNDDRVVRALARKGFFDGTIFHRIVPGFVIQGGDPTASGLGGPGYTTVDPPPASTRYTHGVVAMAKSPTEPPGRAGSQFFVVTAPDAGLPPEYAVLGTVVAGLAVVDRIGRSAIRRRRSRRRRCDREGDRLGQVSIAAVVLAAGAATRYGGPKQNEFLPAVLARSRSDVAPRGRCRGRACPRTWFRTRFESSRRALRRLGRRPGRLAALRPRGARRRCDARARRARRRPALDPVRWNGSSSIAQTADVVAATYDGSRSHPVLLARAVWDAIPDEGRPRARPVLVDCSDLRPPGDVDYPPGMPPAALDAESLVQRVRSAASFAFSSADIGSIVATRT